MSEGKELRIPTQLAEGAPHSSYFPSLEVLGSEILAFRSGKTPGNIQGLMEIVDLLQRMRSIQESCLHSVSRPLERGRRGSVGPLKEQEEAAKEESPTQS